ncbi:MAG: DUF2809 domain-containing protein [Ferruginibacter sp.]
MKSIFFFNRSYFLIAVLLFVVEVLIALFAHDRIIRPYVGDFLVVILIYCFVRSFFNVTVWISATGVLLFAYFIEILQYFNIVEKLGLQNYSLAKTIIGTSFEWIDIIAYTLGIITVVIIEKSLTRHSSVMK